LQEVGIVTLALREFSTGVAETSESAVAAKIPKTADFIVMIEEGEVVKM
jgi:hypothetical protein